MAVAQKRAMTRLTRRVAPLFPALLLALLAPALAFGCAVAPPATTGEGGPHLSGKADGASACDDSEIALIECVAEFCSDDDAADTCVEMNCADVQVEVGYQCGECIESYYGDLEVAADRCAATPLAAGPCADAPELIECATANCDGLSGDPLIECVGTVCEEAAEAAAPLCAQCILVSGQAGTEALRQCAVNASPEQCSAEESDAVTTCADDQCLGLAGDEFNECLTTACEAEVRGLNPSCLQCVGGGLDAGADFGETITSCRGTDGPAAGSVAVCDYEELSSILSCGEANCAGDSGAELNECLDVHCDGEFEAAEGTLSDACATCFIYNVEAGGTLAATRSACVAAAPEPAPEPSPEPADEG